MGFVAILVDYEAKEGVWKLREVVMVRGLVLVLVNADTSRGPRKVEEKPNFRAWSRFKIERTGHHFAKDRGKLIKAL